MIRRFKEAWELSKKPVLRSRSGSFGSSDPDDRPDERTVALARRIKAFRYYLGQLSEKLAVGALVGVGIVALVVAIFALSALVFLFAWNVGVDNIAAASGAEEVRNIDLETALAGTFAIAILSRIFKGEGSGIKLNKDS